MGKHEFKASDATTTMILRILGGQQTTMSDPGPIEVFVDGKKVVDVDQRFNKVLTVDGDWVSVGTRK